MRTESLHTQAKRLWGASRFPFADQSGSAYRSERLDNLLEKLHHWLSLKASGFVYGTNGVGKSHLISTLLDQLSEKEYFPVLNTHSTLRGPGLIRTLTQQLGSRATISREDNIAKIHQRLHEQLPRWPALVFDESQNLSAETIEEIRLLNCHQKAGRSSFSMLLVGDQNLMPRLLLGVNQPLLSRMSFSLEVTCFDPHESRLYIEHRLQEAMIHKNPFQEPALNALIETASGNARILNTLARNALRSACEENQQQVTSAAMQHNIEALPWLHKLRS